MIVLDSITSSFEAKLSVASTTNALDIIASWVDLLLSDMSISTPGSTRVHTNGTTAVTICAAPATGHMRIIKTLTVTNTDTVAATLTLQYNDNGTKYRYWKGTLAVDDNLRDDADD